MRYNNDGKTTRLISRFVFSHPITLDNEEKVS